MGVRVATLPILAFMSVIAAVVLIGVGVHLRRRGRLKSRGALVAWTVLIGLLVAYAMTGGVILVPA